MRYTIINGELHHTDELRHWGVKGMRWGVRKQASKDSEEVRSIRKKRIKEMSNDELKKANNRLNLEQQYKNYTKSKRTPQKIASDFIKTAGLVTGVIAAYTKLKPLAEKAVSKIGDKVMKDVNFNIKV